MFIHIDASGKVIAVSEQKLDMGAAQVLEQPVKPDYPLHLYDWDGTKLVLNATRKAEYDAAQQQAVYDAYAAAAQQRITDELKARDYDDEAQLAIYAASAGNPYQAEAQGLIDWITGTVWPAWEALDPATIDPNGAQAWAGALPSPQV